MYSSGRNYGFLGSVHLPYGKKTFYFSKSGSENLNFEGFFLALFICHMAKNHISRQVFRAFENQFWVHSSGPNHLDFFQPYGWSLGEFSKRLQRFFLLAKNILL